ncbi:MFS transporter [Salinarchaeum sp. IM2453]|uniref:MFS transporter n=1 Tax=Salinarchaeum sp. IM2453 TaxID=2862870 RepID=UPI001C83E4EB|nr:MFS transporter [Salinarchaeum sp. IM2453]QZA88555.1 MFS transporter [Salinarchaeum sp. IM2453]
MNDSDRQLVKFTSLSHALFHGYELSIPLFIGFWITEMNTSAAMLGTIVAIGYGLIGLGGPVMGVLADHYNSKHLILLSATGMGTGFALLSTAQNLYMLTIAIVIWGVCASVYHPAGLSVISRSAENRGMVFAYHGAGGNIGTAAGPILTIVMLVFLDWQTAALILSIPAFLTTVIGFRMTIHTGNISETSLRSEFRNTIGTVVTIFNVVFILAFLSVILYGIYYRGLLTFLPEVLSDLDTGFTLGVSAGQEVFDTGQLMYTVLLTVGIFGQYVGGRLTNHVSSSLAFAGALASLGFLGFFFPVAYHFGAISMLVVSLLIGFVMYGTAPIYQVVIADYSPSESHGISYGLTYLAMFGVGATGASLAGIVLTYASYHVLFLLLGTLVFAGVGSMLLLRYSHSETNKRE